MSERMVQLPVEKEVRDLLKEKKGILSYSQYLKNLAGSTLASKPASNQHRGGSYD